MDVLTKILSYFAEINKFYVKSENVFNVIKEIHKQFSYAIDCDIFHPSSSEMLQELERTDFSLYQFIVGADSAEIINTNKIDSEILRSQLEAINEDFDLKELIDLSEFLRDELISKQPSVQIDFTNIDKLNALLKDVADKRKSSNPCIDINREKINREDEIAQMERLIEESGKEIIDEELKKFIESCKRKDEVNPDNILGFEKYTKEEIEKAKENCFDENTPIPDDRQTISDDVSDGLKDPISNGNINDGFEDDIPPTIEFNENTYEVLLDLMGSEKSKCFSEMKRLSDEMQDISNQYTEHISKKIDIEKKYAYNKLFFEMYDEFDKAYDSISITSLGISDLLFDFELKEYSKEIHFKLGEYYKEGGLKLVELQINTLSDPDEDDGLYFESYEKLEDIMSSDRIKNGEATQEEYEAIDKYSKELFESTLESFVPVVRSSANSYIKDISILTRLQYKDEFKKTYSNIKQQWEDVEKLYLDYDNKSSEYVQALKDKANEMTQVAEELGCSEDSKEETFFKETPGFDIDSEGDFRGIPDINNPSLYDKDYWKKFAQMATIVGLFPIPQFFGSNEFRMNFRDYTRPSVKIPNGSPAIDDDGIPRFLFYPIGFVIPTPFSADFIYRIPLPMIWQHIFVTPIQSPLRALQEKLLEYSSIFGGLHSIRNTLTEDIHPNTMWRELPNGVVESIMNTIGISDDVILEQTRKIASDVVSSFKNGLDAQLLNTGRDVVAKYNGDASEIDNIKREYAGQAQGDMEKVRNNAQSFLNINLKDAERQITTLLNGLDTTSWFGAFQAFSSQVTSYVNAASDIVGSVNSCVGLDLSFGLDLDNYLLKIKNFGPSIGDISGLRFPTLNIPILDLREYLDFSIDKVLGISVNGIEDFLSGIGFDSLNVFPKLGQLLNIITDYLTDLYLSIIKFKLWEMNFPLEEYLNLDIPQELVSSLSLTMIDFPDMILVGFLGISGVIPYPFMLLINPSNKSVPGLIDERTIEFVLTADFTDPIKVIKKNFGSYTLPIRTHIEDLINSSLGLYHNPTDGRVTNACDIIQNIEGLLRAYRLDVSGILDRFGSLDDIIADIIGELTSGIDFDFKLKDLYNLIELPNPNLFCKMSSIDSFKDGMDQILSGTKLNTTFIPPSFANISKFSKYGLPNWNGGFMMDEFKDTFDVSNFPDASDILPLSEDMKRNLLLKELGQSKKMIFDLIPQLTMQTPFLQDDLPTWERLQWWNIPFIAFLIEFNIAGKRGAKFPIPEVISSLNM